MDFTHMVLSNLVAATILALLAWGIGLKVKRPQIRHVLWVLVLCKLISPALISFPTWRIASPKSDTLPVPIDAPDRETVASSVTNDLVKLAGSTGPHSKQRNSSDFPSPTGKNSIRFPWFLLTMGVWIGGSIVWFALAAIRLIAFWKALRGASVASNEWQEEMQFVADRLGLRRIPQLLLVDAAVPPMVWSFARRTLLILPGSLMHRLDASQRRGIVAHELAHLRRGDHWIRWGEFLVVGIYWWNPVAWWARREVHRAEEECCDASVIQVFPEIATDYAQTLLDTVDFLAADRPPELYLATTYCGYGSLNRRITMVLDQEMKRELHGITKAMLWVFTLGVLPMSLLAAPPTQGVATTRSKIRNNLTNEPVVSRADASVAITKEKIIQAVADNEKLYDNLDLQLEHSYKHFAENLDNQFIAKETLSMHCVFQSGKYHLAVNQRRFLGTSLSPEPARYMRLYDGATTRVLDADVVNLVEGRTDDHRLFRPHMALLEMTMYVAPLSVYLKGHDAMLAYRGESWSDTVELLIDYIGPETVDGLATHHVRIENRIKKTGSGHDAWDLWLAEDRNFLPIKLTGTTYKFSGTVPMSVGRVNSLKEIRPGLWIPESYTVEAYSPFLLEKGIQEPLWKRVVQLKGIRLDPSYPASFFRDLQNVPDGAYIYKVRNGQIIESSRYRAGRN